MQQTAYVMHIAIFQNEFENRHISLSWLVGTHFDLRSIRAKTSHFRIRTFGALETKLRKMHTLRNDLS